MSKLKAFRFTLTREYYGVIVAENEDEAQEALNKSTIDEIDCAGGELEVFLNEATRDDVDAAELNEVLFDVHGGTANALDVSCWDDESRDGGA